MTVLTVLWVSLLPPIQETHKFSSDTMWRRLIKEVRQFSEKQCSLGGGFDSAQIYFPQIRTLNRMKGIVLLCLHCLKKIILVLFYLCLCFTVVFTLSFNYSAGLPSVIHLHVSPPRFQSNTWTDKVEENVGVVKWDFSLLTLHWVTSVV